MLNLDCYWMREFFMKADIASPLLPVNAANNGPLSPFLTFGIVGDLCINHGDYCLLSIDELMTRVLPALQAGQAHVVFDQDKRPLGFASWVFADDAQHERLLEHPFVTTALSESASNTPTKHQHLWFVDLITPFSSPLTVLLSLKEALASFPVAWALISSESTSAAQPRRIW